MDLLQISGIAALCQQLRRLSGRLPNMQLNSRRRCAALIPLPPQLHIWRVRYAHTPRKPPQQLRCLLWAPPYLLKCPEPRILAKIKEIRDFQRAPVYAGFQPFFLKKV